MTDKTFLTSSKMLGGSDYARACITKLSPKAPRFSSFDSRTFHRFRKKSRNMRGLVRTYSGPRPATRRHGFEVPLNRGPLIHDQARAEERTTGGAGAVGFCGDPPSLTGTGVYPGRWVARVDMGRGPPRGGGAGFHLQSRGMGGCAWGVTGQAGPTRASLSPLPPSSEKHEIRNIRHKMPFGKKDGPPSPTPPQCSGNVTELQRGLSTAAKCHNGEKYVGTLPPLPTLLSSYILTYCFPPKSWTCQNMGKVRLTWGVKDEPCHMHCTTMKMVLWAQEDRGCVKDKGEVLLNTTLIIGCRLTPGRSRARGGGEGGSTLGSKFFLPFASKKKGGNRFWRGPTPPHPRGETYPPINPKKHLTHQTNGPKRWWKDTYDFEHVPG